MFRASTSKSGIGPPPVGVTGGWPGEGCGGAASAAAGGAEGGATVSVMAGPG